MLVRIYIDTQILYHVIASGIAQSLCGEANSSHADELDEFASSFLLAMTIESTLFYLLSIMILNKINVL